MMSAAGLVHAEVSVSAFSSKSCVENMWCVQQWGIIFKFGAPKDNDNSLYCFGIFWLPHNQQLAERVPFLELRVLLDNTWLWVEGIIPQCGILHVFKSPCKILYLSVAFADIPSMILSLSPPTYVFTSIHHPELKSSLFLLFLPGSYYLPLWRSFSVPLPCGSPAGRLVPTFYDSILLRRER